MLASHRYIKHAEIPVIGRISKEPDRDKSAHTHKEQAELDGCLGIFLPFSNYGKLCCSRYRNTSTQVKPIVWKIRATMSSENPEAAKAGEKKDKLVNIPILVKSPRLTHFVKCVFPFLRRGTNIP